MWFYIFIFFIFLVIAPVAIYNNIIRLKNIVNNSFSTIDVMLQKRYDLIPNLVETVKGYAAYEKSVLEKIISLRTQASNSALSVDEKVKIDNQITDNLRNIFAISEGYPELKASQNFVKLQESLIAIENEISAARRAYNSAATEFNINITIFPNNIFVGFFSFGEYALFETNDKENIKVNLG